MKNSFNIFFKDIVAESGLKHDHDLSLSELRNILSKINEYFYTTYDGIGTTNALDETFGYFSEFHKFWEKYHKDILSPVIDDGKCEQVAKILNQINIINGNKTNLGIGWAKYISCSGILPVLLGMLQYPPTNIPAKLPRDNPNKNVFNVTKRFCCNSPEINIR